MLKIFIKIWPTYFNFINFDDMLFPSSLITIVLSAYIHPISVNFNDLIGKIVSNWKKESSKSYRYEIKIPKGSIANVSLPVSSSQEIKIRLNKNMKKVSMVD